MMDWIDNVAQAIAELDYSSIEGQPEVMQVTAAELRVILERLREHAAALAQKDEPMAKSQCGEVCVRAGLCLACGRALPEYGDAVARVHVHKTGGNAGLAWSAVPTDNAPHMQDGEMLYSAPQPAPVAPCKGIPDPACHYLASCGSICNKCGREHRNVAPMPAQPSDERTTFESFAADCPMGRFDVSRKGDGYWSSHTQIMWDTWKARAVLALRPVAQPLTDYQIWSSNEIMACNASLGLRIDQLMNLIRTIERAHKIGNQS